MKEKVPHNKFVFHGAEEDTTYTVKVTLVLNGRSIASAQKKIKAQTKGDQINNEIQNLLISQLNIQSVESPSIVAAGGVAVLTTGLIGSKDLDDLQLEEENDLIGEFALEGETDMGDQ